MIVARLARMTLDRRAFLTRAGSGWPRWPRFSRGAGRRGDVARRSTLRPRNRRSPSRRRIRPASASGSRSSARSLHDGAAAAGVRAVAQHPAGGAGQRRSQEGRGGGEPDRQSIRGGSTTTPGFERIKNDPAIEAVYIVLPDHMHDEYTVRAAQAGKRQAAVRARARSLRQLHPLQQAAVLAGRGVPPGPPADRRDLSVGARR